MSCLVPVHKTSTVAAEVVAAAGEAARTWIEGRASRVAASHTVPLLGIAFDLMIALGLLNQRFHCCTSPVCPSTARATSPYCLS